MRDGFDREISYARLSVTDRCTLRCRYCMRAAGGPWLNRLLSDGELLKICRCLASLGVTRFRVTGGEPLCRPGVEWLIADMKAVPGVEAVSITTNGVTLAEHLPALLDAGVDGINLSLDTLDRARFRYVTRRDALGDVLAGLSAALEQPTLNLKLNCVAAVGRERDWLDLAALARERPVAVRFIEPMPLGPGAELSPCGEGAVLSALEAAYGPAVPVNDAGGGTSLSRKILPENGSSENNSAGNGSAGNSISVIRPAGSGPARYVTFSGFTGIIGFISAVSHPFCAACNRVRVTADGFLRTCLYAPDGVDLVPLLSGPEDVLREAMAEAVRRKPAGHRFAEGRTADGVRMNRIGG